MTEASEPHLYAIPTRTPRQMDPIWDTITEHFGKPRTKTERTMVGRVAAELLQAGATEAETRKACQYVLATFDSPSVNALPKWFTVAQNGNSSRRSAQEEAIAQLRMQG